MQLTVCTCPSLNSTRVSYHSCIQYHVERLDQAFYIDWCFLWSMIKAEEVGTTRVAGQGTVCLEMRVVKSRLRPFLMLCSFCWVGFSEVTVLIRTADVQVYTAGSLFCVT